jgi:hypothetical protein
MAASHVDEQHTKTRAELFVAKGGGAADVKILKRLGNQSNPSVRNRVPLDLLMENLK